MRSRQRIRRRRGDKRHARLRFGRENQRNLRRGHHRRKRGRGRAYGI